MRCLIIGILLLCLSSVSAQKVLVLEKVGTGRYFTFREGDEIRLCTRIGSFHIREDITRITDSSITVRGEYSIALSDILYIEKIYRNRKANGLRMVVGGGILLSITCINNISHNNPVIDPVFLLTSAGIASSGLIWYSLGKRKYRIGEHWKLKVLEAFL